MLRMDGWVLGLAGWIAVACQGDVVGVKSETGNPASGGGPSAVEGSGGYTGSTGGSDSPSSSGGSAGSPNTCDEPACTPTVLFGSAGDPSVLRAVTYKSGAVLDSGRIYLTRQVMDATVPTGLDYWLRVTVVNAVSGGTQVLSGAGELASMTWNDFTPLAIDATHVYWFSRNDPLDMYTYRPGPIYLRRAERDRAQPEDLARFEAGDGTKPMAMAVDDTYVYWTSVAQGIYRYPKVGGGGSTPELVKSATGVLWPLALAGDYLYWADTTTHQILRKGVAPATLADELAVSNGPTVGAKDVCGLKWTGTELYFVQCDSPYEVHRVSATGDSDQVIGSSGEEPGLGVLYGSLALDADNAYFLGSQYLYRVPRNGGTAVAIARLTSGSYQAISVFGVDDSSVYLLSADPSGILKVRK